MIGSVPSIALSAPRKFRGIGLAAVSTALAPRAVLGWQRLVFALQVRRERRALRRVGDALLADIGRSRADAECEAGRAFWDLPRHRD